MSADTQAKAEAFAEEWILPALRVRFVASLKALLDERDGEVLCLDLKLAEAGQVIGAQEARIRELEAEVRRKDETLLGIKTWIDDQPLERVSGLGHVYGLAKSALPPVSSPEPSPAPSEPGCVVVARNVNHRTGEVTDITLCPVHDVPTVDSKGRLNSHGLGACIEPPEEPRG